MKAKAMTVAFALTLLVVSGLYIPTEGVRAKLNGSMAETHPNIIDKVSYARTRAEDTADVPVWHIGDEWTYHRVSSMTDAEGNELWEEDNITYSVIDIIDEEFNGTIARVYVLSGFGDIHGYGTANGVGYNMSGTISMMQWIRVCDLAIMKTERHVDGTATFGDVEKSYSNNYHILWYDPGEETYDFPISVGDTWLLHSHVFYKGFLNIQDYISRLYVGDFDDNIKMVCEAYENKSVMAGSFGAYRINGTPLVGDSSYPSGEYYWWYSPAVKNMVRMEGYEIDIGDNGVTHAISIELKEYNLIPGGVEGGTDYFSIRGPVYVNANETFAIPVKCSIPNADINVKIPTMGLEWNTSADAAGQFTIQGTLPGMEDDTPSPTDSGSHGCIIIATNESVSAMTVFTFEINERPYIYASPSAYEIKTLEFLSVGVNGNDVDGDVDRIECDWDGDGTVDEIYSVGSEFVTMTLTHSYGDDGVYNVTIALVDDDSGVNDTNFTVVVLNQPPKAMAGPDKVAYSGEVIEFNGEKSSDADGEVVNYTWNMGNGTIAYGPVVRHAFEAESLRHIMVYLIVRDDDGAEDTDNLMVTVYPTTLENQMPVADLRPLPNETILGGSVFFDASQSYDPDGSIVSYEWDFDGDGVVDKTTGIDEWNVTHTYLNSGIYTASVKVTDDSGYYSFAYADVRVEDVDMVIYASVLESAVYTYQSAHFIGMAYYVGSTNLSYYWDFDGDWEWDYTSTDTGNATWSYEKSGTYKGHFKVTTEDMKESRIKTVNVTVLNRLPEVAIGVDGTTFYRGVAVAFRALASDMDGTVVLYRWDFDGDGTWDEESDHRTKTTHTYYNLGTFNVTLQVIDDSNATNLTTMQITIVNHPPRALFTTNDTVEKGTAAVFDPSGCTDPDGSIVSYEWDFDGDGTWDEISYNNTKVKHIYHAVGNYTVYLRVRDNDGANDTYILSVNVVESGGGEGGEDGGSGGQKAAIGAGTYVVVVLIIALLALGVGAYVWHSKRKGRGGKSGSNAEKERERHGR